MAKYTVNVDPENERELSEAEVRDLRVLGFQVTEVKGSRPAKANDPKSNDTKEG